MQININHKFKKLDGKDVKDLVIDEDKKGNPKRDKEGVPLLKLGDPITLRKVCMDVLVNPPVQIDPMTKRAREIAAEKKIEMWNLAQRIYASDGLCDLGSPEVEMLKKLINRRYPSGTSSVLIVAQAFAVLDPTSEEDKNHQKS